MPSTSESDLLTVARSCLKGLKSLCPGIIDTREPRVEGVRCCAGDIIWSARLNWSNELNIKGGDLILEFTF